jgi:hypothetical protein
VKPTFPMQMALHLLLQGHEYSAELGRDAWEFSVELTGLRELGLTKNDLRWLLHKNYVIPALEVTAPEDSRRMFHPCGKHSLAAQCCFILTQDGVAAARSIAPLVPVGGTVPVLGVSDGHAVQEPSFAQVGAPRSNGALVSPSRNGSTPSWDKDRRMLRYGTDLVKQFKVPAPNQELVLEAFEEEHWPTRIDDPLPVHANIDPKRRLHDTINSLNRNQRVTLLRFLGDGSGEGIFWEQCGCLP